jgi:hypothetical protein
LINSGSWTSITHESVSWSLHSGLVCGSPCDHSQGFNSSSKFICVHNHIYTHKKIGFLHGRYKYFCGAEIPVQDPASVGRCMFVSRIDNAISSPLSHAHVCPASFVLPTTRSFLKTPTPKIPQLCLGDFFVQKALTHIVLMCILEQTQDLPCKNPVCF